MSHHHDHDHHHDNDHPATNDAGKLKILVEHWIKHNSEHKAALEEWERKARGMNMAAIADALENSARNLGESVKDLQAALKMFD